MGSSLPEAAAGAGTSLFSTLCVYPPRTRSYRALPACSCLRTHCGSVWYGVPAVRGAVYRFTLPDHPRSTTCLFPVMRFGYCRYHRAAFCCTLTAGYFNDVIVPARRFHLYAATAAFGCLTVLPCPAFTTLVVSLFALLPGVYRRTLLFTVPCLQQVLLRVCLRLSFMLPLRSS